MLEAAKRLPEGQQTHTATQRALAGVRGAPESTAAQLLAASCSCQCPHRKGVPQARHRLQEAGLWTTGALCSCESEMPPGYALCPQGTLCPHRNPLRLSFHPAPTEVRSTHGPEQAALQPPLGPGQAAEPTAALQAHSVCRTYILLLCCRSLLALMRSSCELD